MKYVLLSVLVMFLSTYGPRVLPLLFVRKPLRSPWLRRFLTYLPYVVLTAMTIPAVFFASREPLAAAAGFLLVVVLSWHKKSLMISALGSAFLVWVIERLIGLLH